LIIFMVLLLQPLQIYLFGHDIAFLFPKGMIAVEQRNLLYFSQILMLLVIIPVYILTFIFSWHYRADNKKATYDPDLVDHKVAEFIWWGFPLVIVIIISIVTWIKTYELDPYRSIDSENKTQRIQVVALQWKWLFIYPEENIATVNFLQIPVNTPIRFEITADAPMNSFWIPKLGGQIYAMPGMETQLNLITNAPGEFRGSSANISGEGFANMHFVTKATSQEEFDQWVKEVQGSDQKLNLSIYKKLAAPTLKEPVIYYQLGDQHLFHQILMKFMKPESSE
jgi:cytochrome o ubiquinol oxidase subunit II